MLPTVVINFALSMQADWHCSLRFSLVLCPYMTGSGYKCDFRNLWKISYRIRLTLIRNYGSIAKGSPLNRTLPNRPEAGRITCVSTLNTGADWHCKFGFPRTACIYLCHIRVKLNHLYYWTAATVLQVGSLQFRASYL